MTQELCAFMVTIGKGSHRRVEGLDRPRQLVADGLRGIAVGGGGAGEAEGTFRILN